eukprot:GGOE01062123.1.p2 GENE.GGOE01062123.1~~GGOE01062123.1.p2  ORF type:complete len:230 (-),score=60.58 GGOE01062123.1:532-1221(-)
MKKDCASAREHLEPGLDAAVEGDVGECRYTVDGKKVALLCSTRYAVEVHLGGERSALSNTAQREALDLLYSIRPPTEHASAGTRRYINKNFRFSFETTADNLVEFNFGTTTTVMYSPQLQHTEGSNPVFKVFVKEEEERRELEDVRTKLQQSRNPGTPMDDCRVERLRDRDWLTFTTYFGDGGRLFKSKVFICLRNRESCLLKWETAADEWDRHAQLLSQLVDSFVVDP